MAEPFVFVIESTSVGYPEEADLKLPAFLGFYENGYDFIFSKSY